MSYKVILHCHAIMLKLSRDYTDEFIKLRDIYNTTGIIPNEFKNKEVLKLFKQCEELSHGLTGIINDNTISSEYINTLQEMTEDEFVDFYKKEIANDKQDNSNG